MRARPGHCSVSRYKILYLDKGRRYNAMTRQQRARHGAAIQSSARGMGSRSRYNFCIVTGGSPSVSRYGITRLRYSTTTPCDMHGSARYTARSARDMGFGVAVQFLYRDRGAATWRLCATTRRQRGTTRPMTRPQYVALHAKTRRPTACA